MFTEEMLQERIGYRFRNPALLHTALIHSSYTNEHRLRHIESNERLEFLGDAVLEIVSSEYLYLKYPEKPEGDLTRTRARMVCEPTLALCAADIELGSFLLLGKGEEATGGRIRPSVTSDAMEALIGAVYLDGGFSQAKEIIHRLILNGIEEKQLFTDSKTLLQEAVQKQMPGRELSYVLVSQEGPAHQTRFTVEVRIGEEAFGRGIGPSKKQAEQSAAYETVKLLRDRGIPCF